MQFDLEMTDALLSTTRAVRKRLDLEKPVPRELILECLALAQQAPTGSNAQGWQWVVVDDPAKREALGDLYRAAARDINPDAEDDYLNKGAKAAKEQGNTQSERVYDSGRWLMDNIGNVPVLAIACIDASRFPPNPPSAMLSSLYGSVFPAVWSFQLALRARGLGSTITTLHLVKEKEAAELLGLPASIKQIALLPVAYTIGTDFKRAVRPGPETITHWNGW